MSRQPRCLEELLQELLQQSGLQTQLRLARLPELWAEVVGAAAARACRLVRFEGGELHVEVLVPAWRVELRLRSEELRRRLNERLGAELVHALRIR